MKDQFATYPVSKMLKDLDFNEGCYSGYLHSESLEKIDSALIRNKGMAEDWIAAPLWWQVKKWLWEKHKIIIEIQDIPIRSEEELGAIYECECAVRDGLGELINVFDSENPITAEIEGIISAVEYLNDQITIEE